MRKPLPAVFAVTAILQGGELLASEQAGGGSVNWLDATSSLAAGLAYALIAIVLAGLVLRRRELALRTLAWLLVACAVAAAAGRLVDAVLVWQPWYRLDSTLGAFEAIVAWSALLSLIVIAPWTRGMLGLSAGEQKSRRGTIEYQRVEEQFKLAFEASPNAAFLVDEAGKITLVNSQSQQLFGYNQMELVGQNIEILIPPRLQQMYREFRHRFLASPVALPRGEALDLCGLRKDGSEFPVEVGLNPVRTSRGLTVLVSVVDLSERRRSEDALRRANRTLLDRNREMEQFVYTVSHDLKSPLVTILGFVGMLREDVAEGRLQDIEDAIGRIAGAAQHMSDLINDLLELSRIGRARHTLLEIDMETLVRGITAGLRTQLNKAGLALQIQPEMPRVMADRARIAQVFENLITNAIKYGASAVQPRLEIGFEDREAEVRFYVKDNGRGIAPEFHDKIFGLFQRLETDQEGTGVGLAIVARVMEVHGGRVWVESASEQGATFWLAFPKLHNGVHS